MLASVLIAKKRDGQRLSQEEIEFFIDGYVKGSIPNYQMSAMAMAIYFQGMVREETLALTRAMIASGSTLSREGELRVDKHSTGGLGDKTSLILAPLLSLYELHVPMISGRGLGITGGTLDKLEAIPGFRTNLTEPEISKCLMQCGCVITGASANLVPADRELYALRDVTATVPSIPLITASIMSKKLAESLDALVLDVKWGSGAFMQSKAKAIALAESLAWIGSEFGVPTKAILSDMNQPLGRMVGNACEVNESLDILQGGGPEDAVELTIELAAALLVQLNKFSELSDARTSLQQKLTDGSAFGRYQEMIVAQGGTYTGYLPVASPWPFLASRSGYVASMDGQLLGQAVIELGGGRRVVGEKIDHSVGMEMTCRIGDFVQEGDELLRIFAPNQNLAEKLHPLLLKAITIDDTPVESPLLYERL